MVFGFLKGRGKKKEAGDEVAEAVEPPATTSFREEIRNGRVPPTRKKKIYTDREKGFWWGELLGDTHNALRSEPGLEPDPQEDIGAVDIEQLVDPDDLARFWKEYDETMGTTYIPDRYYYKDRVGVSRGPSSLEDLQVAFASGIIDRDTFVWGHNMDEFAPLACVHGLEEQVATTEVKFAKWATMAVAYLNPFPKAKKATKLFKFKEVKGKPGEKQLEEEEVACRYPDFPWSGGAGGLPYEGMLDPTMPRGKRIPYSLRKAIKDGNPHWDGKDKEWVQMESFYFNWLHPLDNREVYDQWYGRNDKLSTLNQNFWEYKLQRHLESPMESFSNYEDPYNDNLGGEETSNARYGVEEYPYVRPYVAPTIPTCTAEDYIEEENEKLEDSPYLYTPESYELAQRDLKDMGLPDSYKLPPLKPWQRKTEAIEDLPKATIKEETVEEEVEEVEEEYEDDDGDDKDE